MMNSVQSQINEITPSDNVGNQIENDIEANQKEVIEFRKTSPIKIWLMAIFLCLAAYSYPLYEVNKRPQNLKSVKQIPIFGKAIPGYKKLLAYPFAIEAMESSLVSMGMNAQRILKSSKKSNLIRGNSKETEKYLNKGSMKTLNYTEQEKKLTSLANNSTQLNLNTICDNKNPLFCCSYYDSRNYICDLYLNKDPMIFSIDRDCINNFGLDVVRDLIEFNMPYNLQNMKMNGVPCTIILLSQNQSIAAPLYSNSTQFLRGRLLHNDQIDFTQFKNKFASYFSTTQYKVLFSQFFTQLKNWFQSKFSK